MSMLFKRIKDWATSITAFRTGDVIPVDGPSGTAKMSKDDLVKEILEAGGALKKSFHTQLTDYESVPGDVRIAGDSATGGSGSMTPEQVNPTLINVERSFLKGDFKNPSVGAVTYNNNEVLIIASSVWRYIVVDVESLFKVYTFARVAGYAVPAVLFFSSSVISTENFISALYAPETIEGGEADGTGKFNLKVTPPQNAAVAVINCIYNYLDDYCGAYYEEDFANKSEFEDVRDSVFFKKFSGSTTGEVLYRGGAISISTSGNWKYNVYKVDGLKHIRTFGGISGQGVPCAIFLSGPELKTSNYVSSLYAPKAAAGSTTVGEFDGDVEVPQNATYVAINCFQDFADDKCGITAEYSVNDALKELDDVSGRKMRVNWYHSKNGVVQYKNGSVVVDSTNDGWSYVVMPANLVKHIRVFAGSASTDVPCILFMAHRPVSTANFVSAVYADTSSSAGYLDCDIVVPSGVEFIILNCSASKNDCYYDLEFSHVVKDYVTVDTAGKGDFVMVTDAVFTMPPSFKIVVKEGVYLGEVHAFTKPIYIEGVDADKCVMRAWNGTYGHPALEAFAGHIGNMTIESVYIPGTSQEVDSSTRGAYAVHIESNGDNPTLADGKSLTFQNCIFRSDFSAAVGVGALSNWVLTFENCRFITNQPVGRGVYTDQGGLGAMYIHDQNTATILAKGQVNLVDCSFISTILDHAFGCKDNSLTDGRGIVFRFLRNVFASPLGQKNNIWWRGAVGFTGCFEQTVDCYGNSDPQMDAIN